MQSVSRRAKNNVVRTWYAPGATCGSGRPTLFVFIFNTKQIVAPNHTMSFTTKRNVNGEGKTDSVGWVGIGTKLDALSE